MGKVRWIAALGIILHSFSPSTMAQEAAERTRRPASSREILAATEALQRAVNGKAIVRNRCRQQGKESEIEETAEIIQKDSCKLVLRTRKITHAADSERPSADGQQELEFMLYADFSELTTPVLLETQKFGQCQSKGPAVLKVSSRLEPGKAMPVTRKSSASAATKDAQGLKQTRRDLSLFFSAPAAAEKTRKALERAVKACGGKEWPDEDDLP